MWGAHDGREAMRDAEGAPPSRRVVDRVLHLALCRAVERGGGLVQHEHGGLAEQCARDAKPLLLTAAQPQAALTHLLRLRVRVRVVVRVRVGVRP